MCLKEEESIRYDKSDPENYSNFCYEAGLKEIPFQKYSIMANSTENKTRILLTMASLTICLATCSGLQILVVSEISRVSKG